MSGEPARRDHEHVLRRPRTAAWILFLLTLVSALPIAAVIAAAHPMPEGACSGIGFGCSLYGWDVAGFALLFLGVPYALGLATLLGVLCLLPDRWAGIVTAVAGLGLAVPWVVAGLAAAAAA